MRKFRRSGSGQFQVSHTAFLSQRFYTLFLTTVNFGMMRTRCDFALRFGEVDEVGARLLATEGLSRRVQFRRNLVVFVVGSQRDDVAGGLRKPQLPIAEIEEILLVLVGGEFLEEFCRVGAFVLTGRLGLGGV